MRSRILSLLVVTGCATDQQAKQCYPVSSFASPVIACAAGVMPIETPPPPAEPPPEPPPPPPKAEVTDDKIELKEKVNFETGSATLVESSKTLLDDVAKILADHPEIEKVQIEGHTDSKSDDAYNLKLSQRRAASVRDYLIEKGIDGKRMVAKGFGESKPVTTNDTDDGREQNRRVELRILKKK